MCKIGVQIELLAPFWVKKKGTDSLRNLQIFSAFSVRRDDKIRTCDNTPPRGATKHCNLFIHNDIQKTSRALARLLRVSCIVLFIFFLFCEQQLYHSLLLLKELRKMLVVALVTLDDYLTLVCLIREE